MVPSLGTQESDTRTPPPLESATPGSQSLFLLKSDLWSLSQSPASPDTGVQAPRPSFLRTRESRLRTRLSGYPEAQAPSSLPTRSLIPRPQAPRGPGVRTPSLTGSGLRVSPGAGAPARSSTSDRRSGRLGRPARSSRPPASGSGIQVTQDSKRCRDKGPRGRARWSM